MEILIMSDTHGLTDEIEMIKKRHKSDLIIHCGDSELRKEANVLKNIEVVKGNCDHGNDFLEEKVIELNEGITCLVTHGHLYDVKRDLQKLTYRAEELAVNFCFFGHTHIAGTAVVGKTIFINPGSLKSPRKTREKTYALLGIEGSNFNIQYFNDQGIKVKENKI